LNIRSREAVANRIFVGYCSYFDHSIFIWWRENSGM